MILHGYTNNAITGTVQHRSDASSDPLIGYTASVLDRRRMKGENFHTLSQIDILVL